MYNLIAFPHYTCGGLLCDILNNTFATRRQGIDHPGAINSIQHSIGKIGDVNGVFDNYDVSDVLDKLKGIDDPDGTWIATHCYPVEELINYFNKVICVTTSTSRSKMYRWARAYYHYYLPIWQSRNIEGLDLLDKIRETAKNYLTPFQPILNNPKVINLEFADVVENSVDFREIVSQNTIIDKHLNRWTSINKFLYDNDFWNKDCIKCYYQAEYEQNLNKLYRYH
jgi:hypothetical protein